MKSLLVVLLTFCLLIFTPLCVRSQATFPTININVCDTTGATLSINNGNYGGPLAAGIPGCCGTVHQRIEYELLETEDDLVASWDYRTRNSDKSPWYPPITLNFTPGKTGIVTLTLQDRYYGCSGLGNLFCDLGGYKTYVRYRIRVGQTNPGGELTSDRYELVTTDPANAHYRLLSDEPDERLFLNYIPDSLERRVNRVTYEVYQGADSLIFEEEAQLAFYFENVGVVQVPRPMWVMGVQVTQNDDYRFESTIYDQCGRQHPGPTRVVKVIPSCAADTNLKVEVSGPGVQPWPEGFQVEAENTYTLSFSGVTTFDKFYETAHNGGDDLILEDQGNGTFRFTVLDSLGSFSIAPEKADFLGNYCLSIPEVKVFTGGRDVTISQSCGLSMPEDLANNFGYEPRNDPDGLILEHFAATIKSRRQIVLKPGIVLESGAELILDYDLPEVNPADPDLSRNFVDARSYNEYGEVVAASRSYYDKRGRPIQTQVKNLSENVILASETHYDAYDRAALQTLPAPVNPADLPPEIDDCTQPLKGNNDFRLDFAYREGFTDYPATSWDLEKTTTPDPVPSQLDETVGKYYSLNNASVANERIKEPLTAATSYPYTRTLYNEDGSGEVIGSTRPGDEYTPGSGHVALQKQLKVAVDDPYLLAYLNIRRDELKLRAVTTGLDMRFVRQYVSDEDGRKGITYVDQGEHAIISLYYGTEDTTDAPVLKSYQFYDERGRNICNITPNGVRQYESGKAYQDIDKTTYEYNWKGFLMAINEPDAGRSEFRYARDGRIRFSQDAEQKKRGAFSYTDYDRLLRPVESGEYAPNASGTYQWDSQELLALLNEWGASGQLSGEQGTKVSVKITRFDVPVSLPEGYESFQQNFVMGAVSSSSYLGDGQQPTVTSYFSYDERGRTEWMLQDIEGFGTKLLEYRYDENSNVREVAYQRGQPDAYFHYYEYDADTRLRAVYSGITAPRYNAQEEITNRDQLTHQAGYDYYLTGALKEMTLPQVHQKQVFTYTVDGKLKGINWNTPDVALGSQEGVEHECDAFGMVLNYHANDYQSAAISSSPLAVGKPNQYSGNIQAQQWHSPVDGNQTKAYAYDYDERQQLTSAQFGSVSPLGGGQGEVFNATNDYRVEISGYDENGNIEALVRNGENGEVIADYQYVYVPNKNMLDKVTNSSGELLADFTYDKIGRLVLLEEKEDTLAFKYNAMQLTEAVYADSTQTKPLVTFEYDDRGFRLSKTSYDTVDHQPTWKTWYVRDLSGSVVSIYVQNLEKESDPTPYEVPIYGAARLGHYKPVADTTSTAYYELKDHVGHVRAVMGGAQTVSYLATTESENASDETPFFEINRRVPVSKFINHTPDEMLLEETGIANEAIRINNALDAHPNPVDGGIMLRVFPGDTVRSSVYAKYEDFDETNTKAVIDLATHLANLYSNPIGTGEASTNIFRAIDQPSFANLAAFDELDDHQPKMYLNYLVYNDDFELMDYGFDQVSEAAKIPATQEEINAHPHEQLTIEAIPEEAGYVFVYVSNENKQNMTAYFDDLRLDHAYANLSYAADYFPFGTPLPGREIEREPTRYKNSGEHAEYDPETGLNSFEKRMLLADFVRWAIPDPARQYASPYVVMGNNPVKNVDPDGGRDVNFDASGKFTGITKDNFFHNLFFGSRGVLHKEDGSFDRTFRFADPSSDVSELKAGIVDRLVFVTEDQIGQMLNASEVFKERTFLEAINFFKEEGIGAGKLDFSFSEGGIQDMFEGTSMSPMKYPSPMLLLVENTAHNHMNFGNFLIGAAAQENNIPLIAMQVGAHGNSLGLFKENINGYDPQLDSGDDQLSIRLGFYYAQAHKFHFEK
ncbi:MAG: RHS repeat-associated core domain-containing protein [Bacteroidota bacterium]